MKTRLIVWSLVATAACLSLFSSSTLAADETISYTYDALGRLVSVTTTDGAGGQTINTSTTFDHAGNRLNYTVSGTSAAVLSIGSAGVTEGGTLAFPVTRSGNAAIPASASYATANGSATAGSDYTVASGTLSFAAGQTTATINVATVDDAVVESSETITVTLSAPAANTTIGSATGTGTINDNDVSPATLSIGNASVTEGGTLAFPVTRSGNTAIAASAIYATANGSATAGSDYIAASGTVSFAAGQTGATITVATVDDAVVESTETLTMGLSGPSANTSITSGPGTGTIVDNDVSTATISIGSASIAEGGTLAFPVTRSGNAAIAVSATYTTQNDNATAGLDYTASTGTVIFAAGQTAATINVATMDDSIEEANETLTVELSNPSAGAVFGTQSGVGTIIDNEAHTNTILTDEDFNVMEEHQGTYRCGYTANLAFSVCVLVQSSIVVYDQSLANPFDPHYSITTGIRLQVETLYYGTGVAP